MTQEDKQIDNAVDIRNLKVHFTTEEGEVKAVNGVDLSIPRGKIVALVGESGCGKSVTAYSILRLIRKPGRIVDGTIMFRPKQDAPFDVLKLADNSKTLFELRGGQISMIFQEPMTALSPVHTIGNQIGEAIRNHQRMTKEQARQKTIEILGKVGIPAPEQRIDLYPFEMSGGMRQRAVIAMALICNPELLIADEPTTALDVTIQAQILGLMKNLQKDLNTSILLITHDLGVVAQMADEVAIMYLGRIIERADVRTIMKAPKHPYTKGLLESLPSLSMNKERLPSIEGSVPALTEVPDGCPFHPRCPQAEAGVCDCGAPPRLEAILPEHEVACVRVHPADKSCDKTEAV
jgi:oligopeptide/dipeptide ABC transporter ATP-binding protein